MSHSEEIVATMRGLSLRMAALRERKMLVKTSTRLTQTTRAAILPLYVSKSVVMMSHITLKYITHKTRTSMVITMVTGRPTMGTTAKTKLLIMPMMSRSTGSSKRLKSLLKSIRIIMMGLLIYRLKLCGKRSIALHLYNRISIC